MEDIDDDFLAGIGAAAFGIACLLAVILMFVYFTYSKSKDVELEKYKIEMQVNHGDIVEVN